jgi:hypothetical protein
LNHHASHYHQGSESEYWISFHEKKDFRKFNYVKGFKKAHKRKDLILGNNRKEKGQNPISHCHNTSSVHIMSKIMDHVEPFALYGDSLFEQGLGKSITKLVVSL